MAEYHPWRDLRSRDHIVFGFAVLPEATGGAVYARRGDRAAIIIDPRLERRERSVALAHELVHDERGPTGCDAMPSTWSPVLAKEEATVDKIVASRLVPLDELAAWVNARTASEIPTTVEDIAQHFDTTERMAELAALLLKAS